MTISSMVLSSPSVKLSSTPSSFRRVSSFSRAPPALVANATAASLETAGPGKSSLFQRPYVQPVRQTIRRLVLLQPPRCLTRIKSLMDDPPATTSPTASCTANSIDGSTVSTSTLPAPAFSVLQSLASSSQDHPAGCAMYDTNPPQCCVLGQLHGLSKESSGFKYL